MPSIVHEYEIEGPENVEPDDVGFGFERRFRVSSAEGTEELESVDEVCDLICELVSEQFWHWWNDPSHSRRFKPSVKVYEELQ